MADEITIHASLEFAKGGVDGKARTAGLTIDMSGTEYIYNVQIVGTSAEAIQLGDVTTSGYMFVKNLDATNFVEIRDGSGGADVVKLKAGEVALFRLTTTTPYAIADTASCRIEYLLLED